MYTRMKESKKLCDEGTEEVDDSALFAIYKQGKNTIFITFTENEAQFTRLYIKLKCRYKFSTENYDLILLFHSSASIRRVTSSFPRQSFLLPFLFFFLRHLTSSFVFFRSLCYLLVQCLFVFYH